MLKDDRSGASHHQLTRGDMWRIFLRSFMIQAVWNFKRIQNVGWLYSLWPVLKRLYPDAGERRKIAGEHLEYFNTHPYMANVIVGVVAGMEEEARANPARRPLIHSARKYMSGPLAALGDTMFWSALRPLAAVCAFVAGLLAGTRRWWLAPVVFLVLFNGFHLLARAGGLVAGYRLKEKIIPFLTKLNIQKAARIAYAVGLALTMATLVVALFRVQEGRISACIIAGMSFFALRWGLSVSTLVYIVVILSVIIGYQ